jgi:hypothetical protein
MTGSIGDHSLNEFGLRSVPTIQFVDLGVIFQRLVGLGQEPLMVLFTGTDGFHDNWLDDDVQLFLMDKSCTTAVKASSDGAVRVNQSIGDRNHIYGGRNFGSSADNSTMVLSYMSTSPDFPVGGEVLQGCSSDLDEVVVEIVEGGV